MLPWRVPITIYWESIPVGVFTWNGTGGNWTQQYKKVLLHSKYAIVRLYFAQSGIQLKKLKFRFEKDTKDIANIDEYMKV